MTSVGRNLLAMSAVFLLSACGLFGDDDEELEPAELIDFDPKIQVKRLWRPTAGSDATSIPDYGIVCKGKHKGKEVLGLRLIELAAEIAPVGIAWKVALTAEQVERLRLFEVSRVFLARDGDELPEECLQAVGVVGLGLDQAQRYRQVERSLLPGRVQAALHAAGPIQPGPCLCRSSSSGLQ